MSEDVVTASWGSGPAESDGHARWSIVVHGGAGDIAAERRPICIAGCERAAARGALVLARGGSALDAVEEAVIELEADPAFNAGTGACLNAEGAIELDASIMEGSGLRAGAVAALPPFEHPIRIARRVMEGGRHVLLAGEGAARFALDQGFVRGDPALMITELARSRWQKATSRGSAEVSTGGTVGAVARDSAGRLAAATSTGGMVNKLVGRVGDSALIGAGTYADDDAGACSTTGNGEAMIRLGVARSVVEAMRGGETAEAAARRTLAMLHARTGGTGGVIVVRPDGSLGIARTTSAMSWAARTDQGTGATTARRRASEPIRPFRRPCDRSRPAVRSGRGWRA
jgi:beta-aspartyl-peptidase (threonine type)